jgi:hypothetical protein
MKTAPAFRLELICTIGDELRPLMSRAMTFCEAAQIRRHAQQPELVGIFPDTASCRRLARVMKPVAALLPMQCGGDVSRGLAGADRACRGRDSARESLGLRDSAEAVAELVAQLGS